MQGYYIYMQKIAWGKGRRKGAKNLSKMSLRKVSRTCYKIPMTAPCLLLILLLPLAAINAVFNLVITPNNNWRTYYHKRVV